MSALLKDPLLLLRPMSESDVDVVMEVESRAYAYPWTGGIFHDCLRVGYGCWVCILDERIIGHGVMSVAAGECHILNVCLHPDWQHRGLGRKLVDRLLDIARHHKADTAFLEVRESNLVALALYRSMGFNEIGTRRGYYPADNGRENAQILALNLQCSSDTGRAAL